MRFIRYLAAATMVGAAIGCSDLEVMNPNNPDRERALKDAEGLAATQFQQIVSGTLGNISRVQTGLLTAAFENASGLANNGLGPRSGLPRQPIDNNRGNAYATENFSDFRILLGVARNSADLLKQTKSSGFSLGAGRAADETRLKAWVHFTYGVSLGYVSLVYDSTAIPRPNEARGEIPELEGYKAANAHALAQFDSALVYLAMTGPAASSAIPAGWLSNSAIPAADFARVVRSFRARMRAGVARTPAERAAVEWDKVIADATTGIQANLDVRMDPASGWNYDWLNTSYHYRDTNWHQMTNYIIGMADVSGGFDAWLATSRDDRVPFTIVTPDKRFPQGATRAAQNRPTAEDDKPLPAGQYFRNRLASKDQATKGWRNSEYDHYRFRALADAGRVGSLPFFTRAENDMLAAEGYIRKGDIAAAAALIDRTRTVNGLPALAGVVNSATDPVPGAGQCVPRVPVAPNFTSTACGTILEAMKWEKRMETAYTTYGAWFFDSRGWGDLPVGTAVELPVPSQELDARMKPIYNLGGVGKPGGAAASTYGYGSGDR